MKKILSLFVAIAVFGCQENIDKDFSSALGTEVPIVDGSILLDGFIASGSYSDYQDEALRSNRSACSTITTSFYQTFARFRLADISCGTPSNETPFDSGFMYVSRPSLRYKVDPEEKIELQDGPEISGEEANYSRLTTAFTSFSAACFDKLRELSQQLGNALVVADCGKPVIKKRTSASLGAEEEKPNLTVTSKIRLYVRQDQDPARPTETIAITPLSSIALTDAINSMTPFNVGKILFTVGFAGSISKIDLQKGKVIWEKNLTNPSPDSVKQTTALMAVSASSNGKFVAVGANYGYLAVLDAVTGHKHSVLKCRADMFAPKHFVALNFDQAGRSLFTVAQLTQYPDTTTSYNRMIFPEDQSSETLPNVISRWNLETNKVDWETKVTTGHVLAVGFNPDEKFVYVVSTTAVLLFDAKTGQKNQEFLLSSYEGPLQGSFISGATFSADMRLLAIASFSGVLIIDTQNGKLFKRLRASLNSELGNPVFSPDQKKIFANDAYGGMFKWNVLDGSLMASGRNKNLAISYNASYNMPLQSRTDGSILLQGATDFSGNTMTIPSAQPNTGLKNICLAGEDADLSPLTVAPLGKLILWKTVVGGSNE